MTGRKHRSNMELIAQGLANMASAVFGGISVTGTIASPGRPSSLPNSIHAHRPRAAPSGRPASRARLVSVVTCQAVTAATCRRIIPRTFMMAKSRRRRRPDTTISWPRTASPSTASRAASTSGVPSMPA